MSSSLFSFPCCVCIDKETQTHWTFNNILQCQKSSDFLISLTYFSIPLELFYFISCSSIFPFQWIFLQLGAFIVLWGFTHFLNAFAYAPHSFHLMSTSFLPSHAISHNYGPIYRYGAAPATKSEKPNFYLDSANREQLP
ncbi:hypothetical protein AAC387_Pa07g2472 [Persea americana]